MALICVHHVGDLVPLFLSWALWPRQRSPFSSGFLIEPTPQLPEYNALRNQNPWHYFIKCLSDDVATNIIMQQWQTVDWVYHVQQNGTGVGHASLFVAGGELRFR